jgi:hypothetical protein
MNPGVWEKLRTRINIGSQAYLRNFSPQTQRHHRLARGHPM